jgi:hypothetical protein
MVKKNSRGARSCLQCSKKRKRPEKSTFAGAQHDWKDSVLPYFTTAR